MSIMTARKLGKEATEAAKPRRSGGVRRLLRLCSGFWGGGLAAGQCADRVGSSSTDEFLDLGGSCSEGERPESANSTQEQTCRDHGNRDPTGESDSYSQPDGPKLTNLLGRRGVASATVPCHMLTKDSRIGGTMICTDQTGRVLQKRPNIHYFGQQRSSNSSKDSCPSAAVDGAEVPGSVRPQVDELQYAEGVAADQGT